MPLELGVRMLNSEMHRWQDEEQVPHDRRIGNLMPKMLGADHKELEHHPGGELKTRAAELKTLATLSCQAAARQCTT